MVYSQNYGRKRTTVRTGTTSYDLSTIIIVTSNIVTSIELIVRRHPLWTDVSKQRCDFVVFVVFFTYLPFQDARLAISYIKQHCYDFRQTLIHTLYKTTKRKIQYSFFTVLIFHSTHFHSDNHRQPPTA